MVDDAFYGGVDPGGELESGLGSLYPVVVSKTIARYRHGLEADSAHRQPLGGAVRLFPQSAI